ncbi:MAG TPA: hypothetical protein VGA89_02720 [Patescibacteria group bacterium]
MPPVGWLILSLGSLLQLLAVFGSGFASPQGVAFYWLNAFDGMLHLSFIEELVKNFPPIQPGAWPLPITNYHYWSNLSLAELVRIWKLPISHLYFQYLPTLMAPLLGGAIFVLVKQWTKSSLAAVWAIFLHYFAGDMMYVFLWWWHHTWGGHTLTIDNGIIQFLNMPQTFAKLILIGGLLLFDAWQKSKDKLTGWLAGLVLAVTVGFKVYFGLLVALGFSSFVFSKLVADWRKYYLKLKSLASLPKAIINNRQELAVLLGVGVLSALIFFPVNSQAGGLFWAPLDWPKLLLSQGKLEWNEWWLRLQVYQAANNVRALVVWYALALGIFMLAVYGSRLVGFLYPRRMAKTIGWHNFWFLYPGTIIFTFIGLNYLQVSGGHNVFNFFVIALHVLTLFTAIILSWLPKNWLGKFLGLSFIILTIPRVLLTSWFYLSRYYQHVEAETVSTAELEAFDFLTNQSVKLVQTHPGNFLDNYAPMVYFFTNQYSYFGGRGVLSSHNQPIQDRANLVRQLFTTENPYQAEALMKQAGISHLIYQVERADQVQRFPLSGQAGPVNIKVAFENNEIRILEYLGDDD